MSDKTIHVYTDGACRGNPGPGAWGALVVSAEQQKEFGGVEQQTTNNRMELTAAIEALARIKQSCQIILTTDSTYLRDGMTQWIDKWKSNNWRTAGRKPVKNVDLWKKLDAACQQHHIKWQWVRGHCGHPGNERADQIANEHLDQFFKQQHSYEHETDYS